MNNKEKCRYLKGIRKNLADKLGIDLHQKDCTFEGECSGTCPKCQQEEKTLNKALLKKSAALAGAAVMTVSLVACTPRNDILGDMEYNGPVASEPAPDDLSGDVEVIDPAETQKPDEIPVELDGEMAIEVPNQE